MKIDRSFPFHAIGFGLFPILSLYALNLSEVTLLQVARSFLVTLVVTGLLLALFGWLTRSFQRAGLVVSLWSILFFSFGKVYEVLFNTLPRGSLLAQANVLLAVWAAAWILGTWALIRLLRAPQGLTTLMNVIAGAALVSAAYPLAVSSFKNAQAGTVQVSAPPKTSLRPGLNWSGEKPDIYYIILDDYAGQDVLERIYGVDNQPFIAALEAKGFRVATASHTNYWRTTLSLASSLNYHYLEDLLELKPGSSDFGPLEDLVRENEVARFLGSLGYTTVAFENGFNGYETASADIVYQSQQPFNPFERVLLSGSLAVFSIDSMAPEVHRRAIEGEFQQVAAAAALPGPKFVFAHFMLPHPPFVYAADGSPVAPVGWIEEGTGSRTVEQYIAGYSRQLIYTNRRVEELVSAILANSANPPVIILQSDHGPGAYVDKANVEKTCVTERTSNFSAFYLPGAASADIPADITPVNIFRIVFNTYFDTRLALEENRMYGIAFLLPYDLHEVTNRLDWCPGLKSAAE